MFFEGISDLFLVVHELLLFIFEKDPAVDSEDESRCIELLIVVVFGVDLFWREGFSLILGAEEEFDVIFGRVAFEALNRENVILALYLTAPLPFKPFHPVTI